MFVINSRNYTMENLQDLSLADLDSLHKQLMREQGYASSDHEGYYAEAIAKLTNEKNKRLRKMFGEGLWNANISGGIVPGEYKHFGGSVSADVLAHPDYAKKAQESDKVGGVGVEPDKQEGSAK